MPKLEFTDWYETTIGYIFNVIYWFGIQKIWLFWQTFTSVSVSLHQQMKSCCLAGFFFTNLILQNHIKHSF